ncbi:hypothetical protein ACFQVD_08685 [Streptosporangium amethystogenes subsp. fukuiense]|uniref:Uncharacterized protein n=1 Tax=Streptosporangium amethystogenes subsp. fukuiense TaxID=698418 RepID=A0ABW2SV60_9ACTN
MSRAALLPDAEGIGFLVVIVLLVGLSLAQFAGQAFIVKRWPTRTSLDSFFARRRRRLVDAYLGGSGQAADGTALFVQLPGAAATGLWGLSAIVVQIDGSGNDRLLPLALGLFVSGLVPGIIVIWRRGVGPPERIKPVWLIEEEREREAAGEIMRYGRGWVRIRTTR